MLAIYGEYSAQTYLIIWYVCDGVELGMREGETCTGPRHHHRGNWPLTTEVPSREPSTQSPTARPMIVSSTSSKMSMIAPHGSAWVCDYCSDHFKTNHLCSNHEKECLKRDTKSPSTAVPTKAAPITESSTTASPSWDGIWPLKRHQENHRRNQRWWLLMECWNLGISQCYPQKLIVLIQVKLVIFNSQSNINLSSTSWSVTTLMSGE